MKEIRLKVQEAVQDDVNKGIVRIDSNYMQQIGVKPGDIVEIEGERKTAGIVGRAYPGDIGFNTIRTDPLIRRNAKTAIGESINNRTNLFNILPPNRINELILKLILYDKYAGTYRPQRIFPVCNRPRPIMQYRAPESRDYRIRI